MSKEKALEQKPYIMRNDFIDKMIEPQKTETWNSMHGQTTVPEGTFERIFNDEDEDNNI